VGQLVLQREHGNSDSAEEFDLDLAPGFYFLQVSSGNFVSRKKLVVSR
jgi:hypothetical protein